jgi:hypothetical protein
LVERLPQILGRYPSRLNARYGRLGDGVSVVAAIILHPRPILPDVISPNGTAIFEVNDLRRGKNPGQ